MKQKASLTARIYDAIKAELKAGVFVPAQPISAAGLSRRLSTSIIPVREALYRLAGERLVEARDHTGFYAPRINELGLRDLYQAQIFMLLLCLKLYDAKVAEKHGPPPHLSAAEPTLSTVETLFAHLADSCGNSELRWALYNNIDRVHPVSLLKDEVAKDWASEYAHLLGQWQRGDLCAFKGALRSYNRRRVQLVPMLVERLQARISD